jgi:hypothetical protein
MAFDTSKDKVIKSWSFNGLEISVRCYNGGEKKVQIGPRTFERRDGSVGHRKAGRLSSDEFDFMAGISGDIYAAIDGK